MDRRNRSIVAFAKDWDDVPTCITHVFRGMGKDMAVLWVNSIGTRRPELGRPRDISRIFERLKLGFRRAEPKENNLRVLSPALIPKARSRLSLWLNRRIFNALVSRELRDMGQGGRVEYWCTVPNAVDLLPQEQSQRRVISYQLSVDGEEQDDGTTGLQDDERKMTDASKSSRSDDSMIRGLDDWAPAAEETSETNQRMNELTNQRIANNYVVVYYCVDDWSKFKHLDGAWLAEKEKQLLARADVVFTPSKYLADRCRKILAVDRRPETEGDNSESAKDLLSTAYSLQPATVHYIPHGVDYELFSQALNKETIVPGDIAGLSKPVIGFYGNIYPWIHFDLLERLARARPQWSFVMIGQIYCDTSRFNSLQNVRFLGRREHGDQSQGRDPRGRQRGS